MSSRQSILQPLETASVLCLLLASATSATGQQRTPETRAERTSYAETSRYDEVVAFLD